MTILGAEASSRRGRVLQQLQGLELLRAAAAKQRDGHRWWLLLLVITTSPGFDAHSGGVSTLPCHMHVCIYYRLGGRCHDLHTAKLPPSCYHHVLHGATWGDILYILLHETAWGGIHCIAPPSPARKVHQRDLRESANDLPPEWRAHCFAQRAISGYYSAEKQLYKLPGFCISVICT